MPAAVERGRLLSSPRGKDPSDGAVVQEETSRLYITLYFVQETVNLLRESGVGDVIVEAGYTGQPAGPDDGVVMFVARKPS